MKKITLLQLRNKLVLIIFFLFAITNVMAQEKISLDEDWKFHFGHAANVEKDFDYIRMYDPSQHAKTVLEVIKKENLNLKVMIGIDLKGEVSNPNCAWGGDYTEEEIAKITEPKYTLSFEADGVLMVKN